MKFGLDIPIKNELSDIHFLIDLAIKAEDAGWDGFFLWDTYNDTYEKKVPILDPWIAIAAIASHTKKIKLGIFVTPLARRRPWKVAKEMVTLDHLSRGRMIFAVGLGFGKGDFEPFGENFNAKERAEKLDEGLQIIQHLWKGENFSFEGKHYRLNQVQFLPKPFQKPRIPIWVGGFWPNKRPMRRAAKYDGVYLGLVGGEEGMTPEIAKDALEYIKSHRTNEKFDLAIYGITEANTGSINEIINAYEKIGGTWWVEGNDRALDNFVQRIEFGPLG